MHLSEVVDVVTIDVPDNFILMIVDGKYVVFYMPPLLKWAVTLYKGKLLVEYFSTTFPVTETKMKRTKLLKMMDEYTVLGNNEVPYDYSRNWIVDHIIKKDDMAVLKKVPESDKADILENLLYLYDEEQLDKTTKIFRHMRQRRNCLTAKKILLGVTLIAVPVLSFLFNSFTN
jgi:hypothetical protein